MKKYYYVYTLDITTAHGSSKYVGFTGKTPNARLREHQHYSSNKFIRTLERYHNATITLKSYKCFCTKQEARREEAAQILRNRQSILNVQIENGACKTKRNAYNVKLALDEFRRLAHTQPKKKKKKSPPALHQPSAQKQAHVTRYGYDGPYKHQEKKKKHNPKYLKPATTLASLKDRQAEIARQQKLKKLTEQVSAFNVVQFKQ